MNTITSHGSGYCQHWCEGIKNLAPVVVGFVLGLIASEISRRRTVSQERRDARARRIRDFRYFMAGLRAEVGEQKYGAQPQTLCPRYAEMRVVIQQESFLIRDYFDSKLADLVRAAVALNDAQAGTHDGIKKIQEAFDAIIAHTKPVA